VLVNGGATKSYFRAWNKHNIAISLTLAASSQRQTPPLLHSAQGSPDPMAVALSI